MTTNDDDPFSGPAPVAAGGRVRGGRDADGIERDQYGRPLLPDPATGKMRAWTSVTTLAGVVEDRHALEIYKMAQAARGVALRDDLGLRMVSFPPWDECDKDDKANIGSVLRAAEEAAASTRGANLGTALHALSVRVDRGERPRVPAPYGRDLDAYHAELKTNGIEIIPKAIEQLVCVPELGTAGTFDRWVRLPSGRLVVADLKTGKNEIKYAQLKTTAQLAIYANADHVWDKATEQWQPAESLADGLVDREVGLVIHLPAGSGTCKLYKVDLTLGWHIARVAHEVHRLRREAKSTWSVFDPIMDAIEMCKSAQDLSDVWARYVDAGWTARHTRAGKMLQNLLTGPQI